MGSFGQFYQHGGLFNHFITIGFGVTVACLVSAWRGERKAQWLDTATRALLACMSLGLLGFAFGIVEVGAAVATVKPEVAAQAAVRGFGVAILPVAWSLLGVIPLWIVCTVARHRIATS